VKGGFGTVYKGTLGIGMKEKESFSPSFRVDVAVKMLANSGENNIKESQEKLREFMHEAVIMKYVYTLIGHVIIY